MERASQLAGVTHLRRVLAKAVVCGVALILPACQIPKLCEAQPGPCLPETFNGAVCEPSSACLRIDEFFPDKTLTCLIQQALAGNQELKILEQEIRIANNDILLRQGAFLPFVNLRAGAAVDRHSKYTLDGAVAEELEYEPGKHFPSPLPDFLVAANVTWQVDIWRKLRNARDAAGLRYLATAEGRNYIVTRLVAEVAEKYFELMALDNRLETLNQTIALQQRSLQIAQAKREAGRDTDLPVKRFQAEVLKNQSERLVVAQEIIEVENRINFLLGRYPQRVERSSDRFLEMTIHPLCVGAPAQLLQNRPDIRQAERELEAAGLDVLVARAEFFPSLDITGNVGYRAFNPKFLFHPEALIANAAGDLVAPLINKKAIQAEYMSANARQLQRVYEYQRVILNAFTEVINRMAKVENYTGSIAIKRQQLAALKASVEVATDLFNNARAEYVEVLLAQRDFMEARMTLIEAKKQQLRAVVNAYQALGGGNLMPVENQCPPAAAVPPAAEPLPPPDAKPS